MSDAVIRNFQVIGEAIKGLSTGLRDKHPDVPWRDAAQFRDKVIHDYLGIDLDVVWQTVEQDLPGLKVQIDKIRMEMAKQQANGHTSKLKKELQDRE